MRTTCTTGPIVSLVGQDEAIRLIAQGGYDCLDFSLGNLTRDDSPWLEPDYKEKAAHVVELCKKYDICVGQSHTPFTFRWEDPKDYERKAIPNTIRSLEVSALIGAPIAIVHPLHHLSYADYGTMEYDQNIEFYRLLLPYAKKFGIKIATENMFQYDTKGNTIRDMYADIDELKRAMDTIADDDLVLCVDVGHCGLGRCCTPGEMIRALGHDYVKALHIHDNDNLRDRHTVPFLGVLDWDDICSALRDIRYDGDFCMEVLGGYYGRFSDPELLVKAIAFANDIGKYLCKKIEG